MFIRNNYEVKYSGNVFEIPQLLTFTLFLFFKLYVSYSKEMKKIFKIIIINKIDTYGDSHPSSLRQDEALNGTQGKARILSFPRHLGRNQRDISGT